MRIASVGLKPRRSKIFSACSLISGFIRLWTAAVFIPWNVLHLQHVVKFFFPNVRDDHLLLACVLPACRGLARPADHSFRLLKSANRDQHEAYRGRDGALDCATPPSEPDGRISRIRLSSHGFACSYLTVFPQDVGTPFPALLQARLADDVSFRHSHELMYAPGVILTVLF